MQDTIRQYVPDTFYTNFRNFERYPPIYTFTYEGAIHYMWFKEYHPDDWPTVQKYVASGRWRLAGSWINAVDVNVPSPESLMRQALYGQHFFRQEFNKVSRDVYLPDCFGFGFALPSIAVHSGLGAFTTQKLTWGSSVPIPFPVGRWRGSDGSEVIANLNPGDYVTKITSDISTDPKWSNDLTPVGRRRESRIPPLRHRRHRRRARSRIDRLAREIAREQGRHGRDPEYVGPINSRATSRRHRRPPFLCTKASSRCRRTASVATRRKRR